MKVRNLVVQDDTDKLRVALWQETAELPVTTGSRLVINDATLDYRLQQFVASVNDLDNLHVWNFFLNNCTCSLSYASFHMQFLCYIVLSIPKSLH